MKRYIVGVVAAAVLLASSATLTAPVRLAQWQEVVKNLDLVKALELVGNWVSDTSNWIEQHLAALDRKEVAEFVVQINTLAGHEDGLSVRLLDYISEIEKGHYHPDVDSRKQDLNRELDALRSQYSAMGQRVMRLDPGWASRQPELIADVCGFFSDGYLFLGRSFSGQDACLSPVSLAGGTAPSQAVSLADSQLTRELAANLSHDATTLRDLGRRLSAALPH